MNRPTHTHSRRPTLLLRAALVAASALLALAATGARAHTISADTLAFLKEFPKELPALRASWAGDDYCAGWEGVTCADDGDVTVSLVGRDLVGEVPALPQNVTGSNVRAVHVDLSGNPGLWGAFPYSWGTLSRLRHLDLSNTSLGKYLPDVWNGMTSLETLRVANTHACGSLPHLNIPSLRHVNFSNNHMTGSLVYSWGNMVGLQSVDLSGNRFCGCMPHTWGKIPILNASAPASTKTETCQTTITCNDGAAKACPDGPQLTNADTLRFLQGLTKQLPQLRGEWEGAKYCTWPYVVCAASGEVRVELGGARLNGELAVAVGEDVNATAVRVVAIDVSDNLRLRGAFPAGLGALTRLRELDLSHTGMQGHLPDEWSGMTALQVLRAGTTRAHGHMPHWTMPALRVLDLSNNGMVGDFSTAWGAMTSLQSVDLRGNRFCPCMPNEWNAVPALVDAVRAAVPNALAWDCKVVNSCRWTEAAPAPAAAALHIAVATVAAAAVVAAL